MSNQFVTVRHPERGDAEITAAEVESYRAMGFEPVDKSEVAAAKREDKAAGAPAEPLAAANGTDQRLDLILDELRGLRKDLSGAEDEGESEDGETVELREPGTTSTTTTPAPTTTTTTSTTTAAPKR